MCLYVDHVCVCIHEYTHIHIYIYLHVFPAAAETLACMLTATSDLQRSGCEGF